MSKTSIRSKTSVRSFGRQKNKKSLKEKVHKQFGFCCSPTDYDPLTKYDQRNPPFKSSLTPITSVHECPVVKIKTQFIENGFSILKKKGYKVKSGPATEEKQWINQKKATSAPGTLVKYLEDDLQFAIIKNAQRKQEAFIEERKKNITLGKKRVKAELLKAGKSPFPYWYQDFSNAQMKLLTVLKDALRADYEEKVTYRTQQNLLDIGIISTFFKLSPRIIKKLQRNSNLRPVDFLRQTYKFKTGIDFEDEDFKREYNSNERLILSGIAFLALPETIIELNERLPPIKIPKYPPKPILTQHVVHKKMDCPYKEKLFLPPDVRLYKRELIKWRNTCKMIPKPKVILPPIERKSDDYPSINKETEEKVVGDYKKIGFHTNKEQSIRQNKNKKLLVTKNTRKEKTIQNVEKDNANSKSNKEQFDFTLSGLGEGAGPVQYKICGTLDPSEKQRKSWLGEKDLHYIISGIINEDEPPEGPVTYELTGLAKVTPNNSNEEFFAQLKLGDGPKKIYPRGRKYLSKNWQDWLENLDEEFLKVESEANKLIESVEATMRLVVPEPTCDSCCACRQAKKVILKKHATKTPHMVIDSITEDANNKRYIVGSLSMHSPAPSLAESTVNLLEVVASHDKITKNVIVNGITNDDGQTIYYISGVTKDTEHVPQEKIEKIIPKSVKNVPPCACAIEKMFNEGLDHEPSDDNIPFIKDGTCFGKKYRSKDGPAYSCKQYPVDKSCGRNPFMKRLQENRKNPKMGKIVNDFYPPEERNMFSLPDFQPCGDEDGMAICGGPWGAINIPSPEELARREEEAREILKAPSCGEKPGQSVCGGPWGSRIPKPIPPKKEDDDGNEDEEDDVEKEKTKVPEKQPVETQIFNKKALNRHKSCHMSPENIKEAIVVQNRIMNEESDRSKLSDEIEWDAKRTAPSAKKVENIYERELNLTQANPQASHSIKKYEKQSISKDKIVRKKYLTNKELTDNKNKKESKRHLSSQKSLPDNRRSKSDDESKFSKSATSKLDQKIKLKRLVNSVKQPSTARGKNKEKNLTKDDKSKISKNNNYINIANKLPILRPPKLSKESTYSYKKNIEKLSKKITTSEIKSKHEKLEQLKQDMKNVMMLNEIEVQPAIIPQEQPKCGKPETKYESGCNKVQSLLAKKGEILKKEGPFGWRTESEQKLDSQKTLIYLTEPTYPIETIPVRPGGKACHCRESRNKKKILKYNIGGLLNNEGGKRKKVQNVTQVIEGITYVTPPPSPRRSDEYIPEYELYESPYHICLRKNTNEALKLTEKFLGFPSLMSKKPGNNSSCGCSNEDLSTRISSSEKKKKILEKDWASENTPNEWTSALKDDGLIDVFARSKDDVPCWLNCSQFSKSGCCDHIRKLQVKKPVCECKYERKIVERKEEKEKWLERQKRLKSYKKTPFTNIGGISRPMEGNQRFIISGVKKIPKEDGDDVKYWVSGVAENYKMGPVQYLINGVNMQTPLVTPKPSKKNIPCVCAHKHWSVTQLPENMTSSDKEKIENSEEVKENQKNVGPRRCNDAAKCKELANIKEVYNFKRKSEAENDNMKNELKNKENKYSKKKGRRKDDKNRTQESSSFHSTNFSKSEIQGVLKTQVQEPLKNHDAGQISSKHKLIKKDQEKLTPKVKVKPKKVKKYVDDEVDLMQLVINELADMATEGYIFAKLPRCHKMPQIHYWIMYRKGVLFTDLDKQQMMKQSLKVWKELRHGQNIQPPFLDLKGQHMEQLNFEKAFELKHEIAVKKNIFYHQLREDRVKRSAALWNTMEFGKFPSISFKKTYFTYLPAKESDGHLLEPH